MEHSKTTALRPLIHNQESAWDSPPLPHRMGMMDVMEMMVQMEQMEPQALRGLILQDILCRGLLQAMEVTEQEGKAETAVVAAVARVALPVSMVAVTAAAAVAAAVKEAKAVLVDSGEDRLTPSISITMAPEGIFLPATSKLELQALAEWAEQGVPAEQGETGNLEALWISWR